jgi:hypothetical protein
VYNKKLSIMLVHGKSARFASFHWYEFHFLEI